MWRSARPTWRTCSWSDGSRWQHDRLANGLLYKEILRFWKVGFQTVAAPVLTAMLYLLIFGHVLEDHVKVYDTVSYTSLSGARPGDDERAAERFANSSSSLIQSKIMGNLVFLLLLTPLSHWSLVCRLCGARPWCAAWRWAGRVGW
jgi:ABC-2 type transport system permease protein